jgi:ComF family protein
MDTGNERRAAGESGGAGGAPGAGAPPPRARAGRFAAVGGLWAGAFRALADLAYPPLCAACGARAEGPTAPHLCASCAAAIVPIGADVCRRCGRDLGPGVGERPDCDTCRRLEPRFRRAVASGRYEGVLRTLVHELKFARQMHVARCLGARVAAVVAADPEFLEADLLVPVPLHAARERARRFNQAALIAIHAGKALDRPVAPRAMKRLRPTPTQAKLDRAERLKNLEGAFCVRRPAEVAGKTVLLVDDVMTTGATGSECARALRDAGARRVYVAAAAR